MATPTQHAPQGQPAPAHPLHKPHPHQREQEVGGRGCRGQPDGLLDVSHPRHLQDGGAVVPGSFGQEY